MAISFFYLKGEIRVGVFFLLFLAIVKDWLLLLW